MTLHTFKSVSTWLQQFSTDEGPRYALERTRFKGYRYRLIRRHSGNLYYTKLHEIVDRVIDANSPQH